MYRAGLVALLLLITLPTFADATSQRADACLQQAQDITSSEADVERLYNACMQRFESYASDDPIDRAATFSAGIARSLMDRVDDYNPLTESDLFEALPDNIWRCFAQNLPGTKVTAGADVIVRACKSRHPDHPQMVADSSYLSSSPDLDSLHPSQIDEYLVCARYAIAPSAATMAIRVLEHACYELVSQ